MKSKQPKQQTNWEEYRSKSNSDTKPSIGCALVGVLLCLGVFTYFGYTIVTKKEERQKQLEASRSKAVELCREWSKGQRTYINKPGLRLYRQMDSEGKAIPGKNMWIHDPDEFPEEVPSADCFANYSENDYVEVKGAIVSDKYTSESWPCHRGYKLNTNYESNNKYSKKYISCLFDSDAKTIFSSGSHVYEIKKIWRFDLDGNQIR